MLGGKVVRKDNSIDFLGTMKTTKSYLLIMYLLSVCVLTSLGIKMLLTHDGGDAVGPEGNEH